MSRSISIEIEAAISGRAPPVMLDKDMAERLMTVIEALEDRVAGMVERVKAQHIEEEREAAFVDGAASEALELTRRLNCPLVHARF